MLEIRALDCHYGRVQALRGASLTVRARETVALVGANGAGKTTLIKLLCGLYEPTGGRITVDGTDLRDVPHPDWQRRVAAIFQDFVQVDAPIQKRLRGTGLGLSLSRKLATVLGGRVDAHSELGKGSTFSVTIPIELRPAGGAGDTQRPEA